MSLVSGLIHQYIDYVYSISRTRTSDKVRTQVYKDVQCRWQERNTMILSRTGEERMATIDVWVLPKYDIREDYELVKDGKTYVVIAAQKRYDLGGNHDYTRLWVA